MALLNKAKKKSYTNRLAREIIDKAKKANKPSDASTVIELEVELYIKSCRTDGEI